MKLFAFLMLIVLNVVALSIGSAWAGNVTIPNEFVAGTSAVADQVNDNFDAVATEVNDNDTRISTNASKITANTNDISDNAANIASNAEALPLMWGSTDTVGGGSSVSAGSGSVEINSVSITAPANGFLIVSGNIFINNGGTTADLFYLSPYIDGSQALPYESAAAVEAQASGTDGQMITLAYSVTVEITSGNHTVSQRVRPYYHNGAYFYNRNNMTVLFMTSSQGTYNPALDALPPAGIESESPNGPE